MGIINDRFMFKSKTGRKLYKKYAENLPIIDYHCHLPVELIAKDYKFRNAYDLFLSGDHYKWRQMRANGIDEKYITGDADEYEKFLMWARTLPKLIGNPLYHWTALELKRYFGIDEVLCEENAKAVWDRCGELLAKDEYSARNLIINSGVEVVCTTDDPKDDLRYHKELSDFRVRVLPTFRPDRAVEICRGDFTDYLAEIGVDTYDGLLDFLTRRADYFASVGCRVADHGIDYVPYAAGDARAVFEKRMNGGEISNEERDVYRTAVIMHCAAQYKRLGFAMQLHMGAIRNNNRRMFEKLGADAGFDSIDDCRVAKPLSDMLSALDYENNLPKTILYNLNPRDNYLFAAMAGNFQSSETVGKMQFGSGWWFNDQRDGMEAQMRALANLGMLSNFIGMLTDSRSFVSYPRHEYFRRIMCNLIGTMVDDGEYDNDEKKLSEIIYGICYGNAKRYFGF